MSAAYVREYYKVPAKRGMRIKFEGQPGVIVGFRDQYLRVRLDDEKRIITCHPTWEIEYPKEVGDGDS